MTSAVAAVISALVTLFAGDVQVYDGPNPTATSAGEFILVGSTGDADEEAVSLDRTFSPLGNRWISEEGDVRCAVYVGGGDTDISVYRARALSIIGTCEAALASDPDLGGLLVGPGAGVTGLLPDGRMFQRQTTSGAVVRFEFTVRYQALLTT